MITIAVLCVFSFFAGLIDAAVGGGGLIQVPALFNAMPSVQSATLLGTNKMVSICGTASAARSYIGRVRIAWSLVLPAAITAFVMSFCGAAAVSFVPQEVLRPLVFVLIVGMAIYTFKKKDFGSIQRPLHIGRREKILSVVIGGAIGFYDGLFGPGTGSFLIFLFVRCFAFDFLQASASAKFVNLATNAAALLFFIPAGKVLYSTAAPMAVCNILGAVVGTKLAMKRGAGFVRGLFLCLLVVLLIKLGIDMLPRG